MKRPNYLVFGMVWIMAAAVSLTHFIQYFNDRGDLVRAGIFLMMGVFYLWMNKKTKQQSASGRRFSRGGGWRRKR